MIHMLPGAMKPWKYRGYVFGTKTVTGEYVCQACMSPQTGQLDGFKVEKLKEMINCTICGAWVDYTIVEP